MSGYPVVPTYAERVLTADRLRHGRSYRQIALEIGVAHTTVAREVRGHARDDGTYGPNRAQRASERARSRPVRARRVDHGSELKAYAVGGLARG
jgi:IS30 family transposase